MCTFVDSAFAIDNNVSAWVYTEKKSEATKMRAYVCRVGTGNADASTPGCIWLYDCLGQNVGLVRFVSSGGAITPTPPPRQRLRLKSHKSTQASESLIKLAHSQTSGNNERKAKYQLLATTVLPCGLMPTWSFSLATLLSVSHQDPLTVENLLLRLVYIAAFFMFIPIENLRRISKDDVGLKTLLHEVYCTALTLPALSRIYGPDSTVSPEGKEIPQDEWTHLSNIPSGIDRKQIFDCEDAANSVMLLSFCLQKMELKDPLLSTIKQIDSVYYTVMCLTSLSVGYQPTPVWHAVSLKIDKNYMKWLATGKQSSSSSSFHPMCFVDATVCATSNLGMAQLREYDRNVARMFDELFFIRPNFINRGATTKAPASVVVKEAPYLHVQSIHCPELYDELGIVQMELTYNGKLCMPMQALARYEQGSGVRAIPIIPGKEIVNNTMSIYNDGMPPIGMFSCPVSDVPCWSPTTNITSTIERFRSFFVMRTTDWEDFGYKAKLSRLYAGNADDEIDIVNIDVCGSTQLTHVLFKKRF